MRLPGLDAYDSIDDRPQTRPRRPTESQLLEDALPVIGSFTECWCGLPLHYDRRHAGQHTTDTP